MNVYNDAIEVSHLSKRFGRVVAVDDLSFTVAPARVTGFLGPNGAGKTTTLRMLLGLVAPDSGSATFGGRPYRALAAPASVVGAALEATGFHPARTGLDHLRIYCTVNGYPPRRADELMELVGLADAKGRAAGGYSLGMRQRLALAAALLGDPDVLILDEPANGLDPEGVLWMRRFLREYADSGRTVLVSSHVLAEMQQLIDHVVILSRGRLVQQGSLAELLAAQTRVLVRSPEVDRLLSALRRDVRSGLRADRTGPDTMQITDLPAHEVGRVALAAGVELHELTPSTRNLEQVFFDLTQASEPERESA
jgi:ABC-2 type transport system ATP-binding protein